MMLPDQTPKLPKWPFLVADAALLAAAWLIAVDAAQPLPVEAVAGIVVCVVCAAIAGAIPFLTDYARRQDEALDTRQRSLEALARHATAAAEQISIAAIGLRETADSAQKSLGQAGQLPLSLQDRLAEFAAAAARSRAEDHRALEADLAALRTALSEQLTSAFAKASADRFSFAKVAAELSAVAKIVRTSAEPARPAAPPAVKAEPVPEALPPSVEPPKADLSAEVPPSGTTEETPAVIKPPRKRAPRKPVAASEEPAKVLPNLELESAAPAASEFTQSSPDEVSPASSLSADGATRLLVTAYIGIGNRLFIRGEGPGLSWEKGVPLQFVSIGKWRWDTSEAAGLIAFKLYKNDEIECTALGTATLEPGRQQEVTAAF